MVANRVFMKEEKEEEAKKTEELKVGEDAKPGSVSESKRQKINFS